jgi:hypothetical protein
MNVSWVRVAVPHLRLCALATHLNLRFGCDDKIWQETQICAVLRALDMPSPFTSFVDCLRVFQPLSHPSEEKSFLQSVEVCMGDTRQHGSDAATSVKCLQGQFKALLVKMLDVADRAPRIIRGLIRGCPRQSTEWLVLIGHARLTGAVFRGQVSWDF